MFSYCLVNHIYMYIYVCVYGGGIRRCLHALTTESVPIMSELIHVLVASSELVISCLTGNCVTLCCVEFPNPTHSAMTQPYGIRHPAQQRVDYGQGRLSVVSSIAIFATTYESDKSLKWKLWFYDRP